MTGERQKLSIKDLRDNKDELIHLYNVEQKTSTEIFNKLLAEGYEINKSTVRRFFTEVRSELIEQTRYNDSVNVLDAVKDKIIAELDKGTSLITLSTKSEELLGVKVSRPSLTRYVKLIDYKFKTSVIDRFMQYSAEVEQLLNTMRGKALIEYMNEKYNETFTEKTLVMYKKRVKTKTYTQRQKEWVEANADYLIDLRVNQLQSLHKILAIINANNAIEIKEGLLYDFYISRGIDNNKDILKASQTKVKATSLKNWGTENPMQSEEVKRKTRETNLKRYGETHWVKTEEGRKKLKNIHKSYTEEFKQEILRKRKETHMKRHGVEHPLQRDEVKQKIRTTNLKRYGTKSANGNAEVQERRREKYKKKHGVISPSQRHYSPLARTILENEENFKIYLMKLYYDNGGFYPTQAQVALTLDISVSNLSKIVRKYNATDYISSVSVYHDEVIVCKVLDKLGLAYELHNRALLGNLQEVDIYIPSIKTAIEVNPSYTHNSTIGTHWGNGPKPKTYHQKKTLLAAERGIRLIHLYDWDFKDEDMLERYLGSLAPTKTMLYARKAEVVVLAKEEVKDFLNQHHIQKYRPAQVSLGLKIQGVLVQVMTFGKPRFNKHAEYELIRLATHTDYGVVGGSERLFSHFIKQYNPESIVSYANLDKHQGNVYKKLSFIDEGITSPNYRWVNLSTGEILTRYQTQMQNEQQTMIDNGYVQVFDSGNRRFIYTREKESDITQ